MNNHRFNSLQGNYSQQLLDANVSYITQAIGASSNFDGDTILKNQDDMERIVENLEENTTFAINTLGETMSGAFKCTLVDITKQLIAANDSAETRVTNLIKTVNENHTSAILTYTCKMERILSTLTTIHADNNDNFVDLCESLNIKSNETQRQLQEYIGRYIVVPLFKQRLNDVAITYYNMLKINIICVIDGYLDYFKAGEFESLLHVFDQKKQIDIALEVQAIKNEAFAQFLTFTPGASCFHDMDDDTAEQYKNFRKYISWAYNTLDSLIHALAMWNELNALDYLRIDSKILNNDELLKDYISAKLAERNRTVNIIDNVTVAVTLTSCQLQIKPQYIEYYNRYGHPENNQYEAEKMACIMKDLEQQCAIKPPTDCTDAESNTDSGADPTKSCDETPGSSGETSDSGADPTKSCDETPGSSGETSDSGADPTKSCDETPGSSGETSDSGADPTKSCDEQPGSSGETSDSGADPTKSCDEQPGSCDDPFQSCDDPIQSCDDPIQSCDEQPGSCDEQPGSCDETLGSCDEQPGSCDDPIQSCDDPIQSCDDPIQSCDEQPGSCDETPGSCDDPIQSCDDPIQSCDDPIQSCDDPIQSCDEQPGSCDETPGSCDDPIQSCDEQPGSCNETPGSCDEQPGSCDETPGSSGETSDSGADPTKSCDEQPGSCDETPNKCDIICSIINALSDCSIPGSVNSCSFAESDLCTNELNTCITVAYFVYVAAEDHFHTLQTFYYPLFLNKQDAVDANDDSSNTEAMCWTFMQHPGIIFWMPYSSKSCWGSTAHPNPALEYIHFPKNGVPSGIFDNRQPRTAFNFQINCASVKQYMMSTSDIVPAQSDSTLTADINIEIPWISHSHDDSNNWSKLFYFTTSATDFDDIYLDDTENTYYSDTDQWYASNLLTMDIIKPNGDGMKDISIARDYINHIILSVFDNEDMDCAFANLNAIYQDLVSNDINNNIKSKLEKSCGQEGTEDENAISSKILAHLVSNSQFGHDRIKNLMAKRDGDINKRMYLLEAGDYLSFNITIVPPNDGIIGNMDTIRVTDKTYKITFLLLNSP